MGLTHQAEPTDGRYLSSKRKIITMISMILLVQQLVEATTEEEARPKVTGGPHGAQGRAPSPNWAAPITIILVELPPQTGIPNYRTADQEGRAHSLIQLAIEEQTE